MASRTDKIVMDPTTTRWYVKAKQIRHLFQWVTPEGQNNTAERAMQLALGNPNGWTQTNLEGHSWELDAREHQILDTMVGNFPPDLLPRVEHPEHDDDAPPIGASSPEHFASMVALAFDAYQDAGASPTGQKFTWTQITPAQRNAWRNAIAAVLNAQTNAEDEDRRFDLVKFPVMGGQHASLGISKDTPVGTRIMVIVPGSSTPSFISKESVRRITVSEGWPKT